MAPESGPGSEPAQEPASLMLRPWPVRMSHLLAVASLLSAGLSSHGTDATKA